MNGILCKIRFGWQITIVKKESRKSTLTRVEENRHYLHSKPNNEVSARHQLEEKSWKMIFFFIACRQSSG